MANHYCEYCGTPSSNITSLVSTSGHRHPLGSGKGKHKLYEGSEKSQYACKYCGISSNTLLSLTSTSCFRHPSGGNHSPAL